MSTISKGNNFENKVFHYFQEELQSENLFVPSKTSKIFKKKHYFSKDREGFITTDISIETFIPNSTQYSLLTIIECKDYAQSIPVDDIEEFHAKVQQVAGNNVKAIFTTSAALQRSAIAFARSKKIAVVRFLPDILVEWVFYNMTNDILSDKPQLDSNEFNSAFLNQRHRSRNRDFYAFDDKLLYGSLSCLLKNIFNLV